ncbi:hypothetical protein SADUNF_Sadunf18G0090500 [Salix dunnii]|uniref:Uncharacterized protein n=1 Tax=Salix dunnii TaxID=1413687 RepID=A0A835J8L6_9ROSI|nr:hypothetical protein SADUNF_Sadunf18G0090500 [Salix dunnii]
MNREYPVVIIRDFPYNISEEALFLSIRNLNSNNIDTIKTNPIRPHSDLILWAGPVAGAPMEFSFGTPLFEEGAHVVHVIARVGRKPAEAEKAYEEGIDRMQIEREKYMKEDDDSNSRYHWSLLGKNTWKAGRFKKTEAANVQQELSVV